MSLLSTYGGEIGRIVEAELGSFLWQIPGFSGRTKEKGIYFWSAYIHLAEAWWNLFLYPNGTENFPGVIVLQLWRCDVGPPKTFHCTVGVRRADGEVEQVGTRIVKLSHRYDPWVLFSFCTRAQEGKFLSSDTLTLTLRITEEGDAASEGGNDSTEEEGSSSEEEGSSSEEEGSSSEAKDGTSRETQREGLESTTDNENEDRKDDCTSPEARDGTSRETQREGLESTTNKVDEDKKDDCSSPETRGMMLLTKHMRELLSKSDDCDVRFRVQNKEFPAHRNILKARCAVFRMMLTHDTQENQSGIIRIEDCDADAFEIFLMYVYSGKAEDLTPQKAINLYYIADKYDFSELKEQCVALLKGSLSKTTVCDVVLLSAKHGESELMEAATNFFVQNIKEIAITVEWQKFMIEHPIEGNELYIKYLNISSINIQASSGSK